MSLKDIIAAKKLAEQQQKLSNIDLAADLFLLTSEPLSSEETLALRQNLLLLCILLNLSAHKSNLHGNDNASLKILADWLGPYPSDYLPYVERIPRLYQSHSLWQLGRVTGIPPAKLWKVFHEAMIVCYKNFD